ncbi:4Fe-4S ferredoxin iron-sulfur binding domain protein [Methanococcus vannielii SB]|jgi:ferredoxin|uniref:4Fe-4S ferredoxin iron-sulfur binding domain protein n=1 Tax=Methanococcus vannielii (strain ATCC 35089 / DSM 1224 / JCM 13029 / OCM 148 / SB) TaxID=406327 RepID=A6UQA9_METVS|nr:4Fe-4S binding protein [Methanococcus vannielii]ABR54681.1 4Fe-4S ferredoxin iron-sulfur binding domain protein [Methanococcus vannielii SB]
MVSELVKKYFDDLNVTLELESQLISNKIEINPETCILCNKCVDICPVSAMNSKYPDIPNINKSCVYCGNCVDICPVSAIKITKARVKVVDGDIVVEKNHCKNKKIMYDRKKCVMCIVCIKNCPFGAIDELKSGIKFNEKCVLCGHCERICPADAIELE